MEVIVTATGNSLRFEEWWPPLIVRKSHMYMHVPNLMFLSFSLCHF